MLVSIIIPFYNVEKYIDECLKSVVEQTYKNLEIILVNDGSTDKTVEIIKKYTSKDARIKVVTQNNLGMDVARKSGLDASRGELIIFVDSDDYILKNDSIEYMIKKHNKNHDFTFFNEKRVYDYKVSLIKKLIGKFSIWFRMGKLENTGWAMWGKIYSSAYLKKCKFSGMRFAEDIGFFMLNYTKNYGYCSKKVIAYRQRIGSVLHTNMSQEKIDCIKKAVMLEGAHKFSHWANIEIKRYNIPMKKYDSRFSFFWMLWNLLV